MTDEQTETKERKSIVPAGWKSKNDELRQYVDKNCVTDGKFDFDKFFALAAKNGVPEEQVTKYKEVVASNAHGAQGRAKMTVRNMLANIVRKAGKLIDIDGNDVPMELPKPTLSGAAAKAKADSEQEAAA
jgi:hypothetical protein